jgi:hypothetical protein
MNSIEVKGILIDWAQNPLYNLPAVDSPESGRQRPYHSDWSKITAGKGSVGGWDQGFLAWQQANQPIAKASTPE